MRSFHVTTITDIPVRVNTTLLLFLPVLAWLLSRPEQIALYVGNVNAISPHAVDPAALQTGNGPLVIGVVAALGLFVGVLLHELGHSWTARRFGVGISSITLWIFGGMAHMDELPEDWNVEFWIAIAGPAMSVLLGVLGYLLLQVVPGIPLVVFLVGWFATINVTLAIFNLIPAFPMDGGRILRALLARHRPYVEATRTAAAVGKGLAVVMALLAVLAFNPVLILVAMFVYVAAGSESKATVVRDLLRGMTVRDLLTADPEVVSPEDTVAAVAERIIATRHTGFPVVEGDRAVGLVTIDEVRGVDEADRATSLVGEVFIRDAPTVSPDADAFDLLAAMGEHRAGRVLVVDGERLVGIVTQTDLMRALEVLEGVRGRGGGPTPLPDGFA